MIFASNHCIVIALNDNGSTIFGAANYANTCGNPSLAACGELLWNFRATFVSCFILNFGRNNALFLEFATIMIVIEHAKDDFR